MCVCVCLCMQSFWCGIHIRRGWIFFRFWHQSWACKQMYTHTHYNLWMRLHIPAAISCGCCQRWGANCPITICPISLTLGSIFPWSVPGQSFHNFCRIHKFCAYLIEQWFAICKGYGKYNWRRERSWECLHQDICRLLPSWSREHYSFADSLGVSHTWRGNSYCLIFSCTEMAVALSM